MQIQEIYELIKDLKTKEEFEKEIQKRYSEYNELLNKEAIALLIADELGRNKSFIKKISQLRNNEPATIFAEVKRIVEINNEKAILEISDETENCLLNLFNSDLELVKERKIKEKTKLKIVNGNFRENEIKEIFVGKWSLLIIDPSDFPFIEKKEEKDGFVDLENLKEGKNINVKANVVEVGRTIKFKKENREGKVCTIEIFDGTAQTKVVFWGGRTEIAENLSIGDEIVIRNAIAKMKNEKIELHIAEKTTVEKVG